jgi:hypothetical protein
LTPTPSFPDLSMGSPLPTVGRIVGSYRTNFKAFFRGKFADFGLKHCVIKGTLRTLIDVSKLHRHVIRTDHNKQFSRNLTFKLVSEKWVKNNL